MWASRLYLEQSSHLQPWGLFLWSCTGWEIQNVSRSLLRFRAWDMESDRTHAGPHLLCIQSHCTKLEHVRLYRSKRCRVNQYRRKPSDRLHLPRISQRVLKEVSILLLSELPRAESKTDRWLRSLSVRSVGENARLNTHRAWDSGKFSVQFFCHSVEIEQGPYSTARAGRKRLHFRCTSILSSRSHLL